MERTRFRGDLEDGSATGLFGFVATTVRMERGAMASTGCRSIMVRRSTVRRDFGAPGLRHTLASTIVLASAVRRDFGALGPRYTGIHDCPGVCGAPGLRCAGTSVRRDFGAPGLRCTEATSSAASTHGRPGSPHRSEQRAAPAVPVPRTGLLDLAASHGRTPRELHLRRVLDPEGTTPGHLGPPYESSCAATSGAPSALPSRGRNTSVDGAALLGTIDTSEALRLDAFSSVRGSPGTAAARKLRRRRGARRRPASRRQGAARCTSARHGERSHSAAGRRRQRLTHPAPRSRDKLPPSRQAAGRRKTTTGGSGRHRDGNYRSWEHAISTPPSTS